VTSQLTISISEQLLGELAELIGQQLGRAGEEPATSSYLTVEAAAEYLGCCVDHVRTLYRRGEITAFRPGRRVLIERRSLDDYIRSVPA
jgi:excisionase family DNA binding protein